MSLLLQKEFELVSITELRKEITLKIKLEKDEYEQLVTFFKNELFVKLFSLNNTLILQSINILGKDEDSSDVYNYDLYFIATGERGISKYTYYNIILCCETSVYKFMINKDTGYITHGE